MPSSHRVLLPRVLFLVLALAACIPASAQTPPFTQCPHIGPDSGCAYLIVITDTGITVLSDPLQPPFDSEGDDTLIGVQNNSSASITSLPLYGGALAILGFDGSGICAMSFFSAPLGCPFGPTGYEGPGTSFTGISADKTTGTVVFSPPIPPGGSAYFALDGFIRASSTPLSLTCSPGAGPTQQAASYSTTCTVTGGPVSDGFGSPATPVYKWSTVGNLPSGLSLSSTTGSTVTLSGLADSLGPYNFSIQVTDNSIPTAQVALRQFSGSLS